MCVVYKSLANTEISVSPFNVSTYSVQYVERRLLKRFKHSLKAALPLDIVTKCPLYAQIRPSTYAKNEIDYDDHLASHSRWQCLGQYLSFQGPQVFRG